MACAAGAVLALGASLAAQSVRDIPFDAADLLKTPLDTYVGEVGGVGQNSKGQIFVYTRTGHPYATIGDNRTFARGGSRLYQFDKTGKFERELGQMVYGFNAAIGLRVDPQDNVWTIDEAASQIVKLDAEGRVALVLGRKPEAINVRPAAGRGGPGGGDGEGGGRAGAPGGGRGGPAAPPGSGIPGSTFNRPTDVAWDRAGNIYIADGIGNTNRVAKFDKNGNFVKQWGSTGSGNGQFAGVKSLAVDAQGNVYASDTGNKRVQVFDNDGNYKTAFSNVEGPGAMCITKGASPFLYVSNTNPPNDIDHNGEIYKMQLDGTVVGKFGKAGKLPKEFGTTAAIDCRNANTLYVGEVGNLRVQKLMLH